MKTSAHLIPGIPLRPRLPGIVLAMAVLAAGFAGDARAEDPWWLSYPADPYPLTKCVVLDAALEEDTEILDFDGREIRVCCEECTVDFRGAFDTWIARVDERIADQQKSWYPMETCLVDGESLEERGAIEFVFFNRLFLLCSDACCDAVRKEPEKYFGLLNKAVIEKQSAGYPIEESVVSGKPLGEGAIDYVVGNQLVRLAGEEEIDGFDEKAATYLARLRRLTKKKRAAGK